MPENEKKEIREKQNTIRVTKFSRRQFLQRVGITIGGAAMATISLSSACKSSGSPNAGTTTESNTTGATTSSAPASSSTTPSSSLPTSTSTTPATGTPTTSFSYVPPTVLPPLLDVPGSKCKVAADGRLYSTDHIWVKSLSTNLVVLGITSPLVTMLYEPYHLALPKVGSTLACGDYFGDIEGYKMMADLPSPVSGVVIDVNKFLVEQGKLGEYISSINTDPYNSGWMFVIQLSKPDELKALMTAQSYRDLVVPQEEAKGLE